MSSNNTYTPYFYIIQHKTSKKMYAGSRWAIGCHPSEFMQPYGYKTSSAEINSIIMTEGLSIFDILRIDTNCDGIHVYDYETVFLQSLNCAELDNWYNKHNNYFPLYNSIQLYNIKQEKYGDPNYNNPEKQKQTRIDNNGGTFWSEEELEKSRKTRYAKNDGKYFADDWGSKQKQTRINNNSNEKYFADDWIEKTRNTKTDRYGDPNYNNPEKYKETNNEKFGYDNAMKSPVIKEKSRKTRYIKNDGKFWSDNDLEKRKQITLEIYGVDNIAKRQFLSIIETKKTYNKSNISKYYPEFKQYYPDVI
jgi:hypothetical protein